MQLLSSNRAAEIKASLEHWRIRDDVRFAPIDVRPFSPFAVLSRMLPVYQTTISPQAMYGDRSNCRMMETSSSTRMMLSKMQAPKCPAAGRTPGFSQAVYAEISYKSYSLQVLSA